MSKSNKIDALFVLNQSLSDARTLTARNCAYILGKLDIERRPSQLCKLDQQFVKSKFRFVDGATDDKPRYNLIKETTDLRRKNFILSSDDNSFDDADYLMILRNACCS